MIIYFSTILVIANFDEENLETLKFSLSTSSIEWIKTEVEYKAVKYQFEALNISKEESPEKKVPNIEGGGSTRNP